MTNQHAPHSIVAQMRALPGNLPGGAFLRGAPRALLAMVGLALAFAGAAAAQMAQVPPMHRLEGEPKQNEIRVYGTDGQHFSYTETRQYVVVSVWGSDTTPLDTFDPEAVRNFAVTCPMLGYAESVRDLRDDWMWVFTYECVDRGP